jgi:hypothetical protein
VSTLRNSAITRNLAITKPQEQRPKEKSRCDGYHCSPDLPCSRNSQHPSRCPELLRKTCLKGPCRGSSTSLFSACPASCRRSQQL